jgi:uncharacterized membrane protein
MATSIRRPAAAFDRVKYLFFALVALSIPLVLRADERFLIDPADPHWKHIAPFKWPLLVHGLAGLTALATGTLQMSSRLRRLRPALHRAIGKVFLGAVTVAAPAALAITLGGFEPRSIIVEQWFQAGGWLVSPWIAYACIRSGQMPLHKAWMMRSYAFTLIFIFARVPDYFLPEQSAVVVGRRGDNLARVDPDRADFVANPHRQGPSCRGGGHNAVEVAHCGD